MKIKFNHDLDFQNQAISSIVDIFEGQPRKNGTFTVENYNHQQRITEIDFGISNKILLSKEDILKNIQEIQLRNGLKQTDLLKKTANGIELDFTIDMETGERVIIVMGAVNVLVSRVSGTFIKYNSCIA